MALGIWISNLYVDILSCVHTPGCESWRIRLKTNQAIVDSAFSSKEKRSVMKLQKVGWVGLHF